MKKARDTGRGIIFGNGRGFTGARARRLTGLVLGRKKVPAPHIADSKKWTITNIVVKKYKKATELARLLFDCDEFPIINRRFGDDSKF